MVTGSWKGPSAGSKHGSVVAENKGMGKGHAEENIPELENARNPPAFQVEGHS